MSDLRIALIAEGATDQVIIEAALKAILPRPFVLKLLQPEMTRPDLGGGWGGVLKWSKEFCSRGFTSLEDDPTLELYDFFVIHLNVDIVHFSYADYGNDVVLEAQEKGWGLLPCSQECPPPDATVNNLKPVLLSWLRIDDVGDKTVLCIPSKSSEAWLASAVYPDNQTLLNGLECAMNMESRLAQLPKGQRIKKSVREYRDYADTVKTKWAVIRQKCSRADIFHLEIDETAQRIPV